MDLSDLALRLREFAKERDWEQFHNPKDLAVALNIEAGELLESARVLKETNTLPAVCGRVCPQEVQCEEACFYTQKLNKVPVAIGHLERFVADYEQSSGKMSVPEITLKNGIKVASIGSGPAGLAPTGQEARSCDQQDNQARNA